MNPPGNILFVEIAAFLLFVLGFLESRKKGATRAAEFVMIFFYGLLLEELDMQIFKSYHYHPDFLFVIGHVPVCIAWLWAVILASSMAISDRLGLPEILRPFLDALLAVWIDLSIDATAIRIGYWHWAIPLNQGWFGVPAGNLYAWMWVAFFYSAFARIVRRLLKKDSKWMWAYAALPLAAYAGLWFALVSIGWAGKSLGFASQKERLVIFAVQFMIFIFVAGQGWIRREVAGGAFPPIWWWSRLAIHFYFILAFFLFGIFKSLPILGVLSFFILAGEFAIHSLFRDNTLRH